MERRPPTAQGHGPPKEPRTVWSPTPGLTKETMNIGPETSSKLTHTGGSRSGNTPELVARVGLGFGPYEGAQGFSGAASDSSHPRGWGGWDGHSPGPISLPEG